MRSATSRMLCGALLLALAGCPPAHSSLDGGDDAGPTVPPARLFVANQGDDSVSVVDPDSLEVLATVPVGVAPAALAVDDARGHVFVANAGGDTVTVLDASSDAVVGSVTVGQSPAGFAIDQAHGRLYVANTGADTVSVVDLASLEVLDTLTVGVGPVGLGLHPTFGRLFVANVKGGTVSVVDTASRAVLKTVGVGTLPFGVAVDPATTSVYVSDRASNQVTVLDARSGDATGTLPVGFLPAGVAVGPLDDHVYVANSAGNTVSVADVYLTPLALLPSPGGPEALAVDAAANRLFVVNKAAGTLLRLDTSTFAAPSAADTVALGRTPVAVALASSGHPSAPLPTVPDLGVRWVRQPTARDTTALASVTAGPPGVVAVGAGGVVRTSADGERWTWRDAGTRSDLSAVAFVGGQLVAVGADGTVLTSPDGLAWARVDAGTSARLLGVAGDGAAVLAVGEGGVAVSSSDGHSFSATTLGTARLEAVAFGAGARVAVGAAGTVLVSVDGGAWAPNVSGFLAATLNPGTSNAVSADLHSVLFAPDAGFVAEGGAGALTVVLASPDGQAWTSVRTAGSLTGHLSYLDGRFVIAQPELFGFTWSTDAVHWSFSRNHPVLEVARPFVPVEVALAAGHYVAVGPQGSVGTSTDGVDWVHTGTGPSQALTSVTAVDGGFVAMAHSGVETVTTRDGRQVVAASPLGLINPTQYAAGLGGAGQLRFLGGQYVAVGNQGRVATSPDARHWTEHFVPGLTQNGELTSVAYGHGLYVVVGAYATIATSPDAQTWTVRQRLDTGVATNDVVLLEVVFLDGQFVAMGQGGSLFTSSDGLRWARAAPSAPNVNEGHQAQEFHGLAYGQGTYVLVGLNYALSQTQGQAKSLYPSLLTSTDGANWVERADSPEGKTAGLELPGVVSLDRAVYADGRFHVVCRARTGTNVGVVFSSSDAVRWVDRTPPGLPPTAFEDLAAGDGQLVLVGGGSSGPLLLSSP